MREEVVSVFGYPLSDEAWARLVRDSIVDAIEGCLYGKHPRQEEHDALAAEVSAAATRGVDLPQPPEGWAYWFKDDAPFFAYERARNFGIF